MKERERKREAHPCFGDEEVCSFFIINKFCKLESLPRTPGCKDEHEDQLAAFPLVFPAPYMILIPVKVQTNHKLVIISMPS